MSRAALALVALWLAGGCATPGPLAGLEIRPRLELAPGQTWIELGTEMLLARESSLAHSAFARSIVVDGVSAEAYTGAGLAAAQQGKLTEAARHFRVAQELAPNSVGVHNNLGLVLMRLGDPHGARDAFRRAVALSDGRSELAVMQLSLSEQAVAALETDATPPDPAEAAFLQRLGSSEYMLWWEGKPS